MNTQTWTVVLANGKFLMRGNTGTVRLFRVKRDAEKAAKTFEGKTYRTWIDTDP